MKTKRQDLVVALWTLAFALQISGAPLAPSSTSFWDNLYRTASSEHCLLLPKVNHDEEVYFKAKIDLVCNNNGSSVSALNPEARNDSIGSCNALQGLFGKLCELAPTAVFNATLDPTKLDKLGPEVICSGLFELIQYLGDRAPPKEANAQISQTWLSPFPTNSTLKCGAVCKNVENKSLPGDTFQVSPVCMLLSQGYTTYQQVLISGSTGGEPKPNESTAISSTKSSSQDGQSVPIKSKKTEILPEAPSDNKPIPEDTLKGKISGSSPVHETLKPGDEQFTETESTINEAQKSQSSDITKQDLALKSDTEKAEKGSAKSETDKFPDVHSDVNPKEAINPQSGGKLISKGSSTTSASVDDNRGNNDFPLPPNANGVKSEQSSTALAIPKENVGNKKETEKVEESSDKINPNAEDPVEVENVPADGGGVILSPPVSGKNPVEQNLPEKSKQLEKPATYDLAPMGEDDKTGPGAETDIEIPALDPQSVEYDADSSFKFPKNRHSSNKFDSQLPFEGRGTTINVSLNESEATGFFSYFLFCVTLIGLVYLIIHNKKKLIAFVVEGKRPRNRSRRSSSSQYRKLENNFD